MRTFPSVCTEETIPHNCIRLQTYSIRKHSPHTPQTAYPTNMMLGESEGGKGYNSGGQDQE